MPRGKTDAVTSPVAPGRRGTGALKGTWGSPDGPRAKLIFTFTVPDAVAGDEHLRLRVMLSRKLMDAGSVSV
ncbi:PTS sugar transporter subunit IIA [Streptomyces peucetius]